MQVRHLVRVLSKPLQDNEQVGAVSGKRERMSSLLLMSAIIAEYRAIYCQGLYKQDSIVDIVNTF